MKIHTKLFLVLCVIAATGVMILTACSSSSITGTWYFNSMSPSQNVLGNISDDDKTEWGDSAQSLSLLMNGTTIEFQDDAVAVITFANESYNGAYTIEDGNYHVTMDDSAVSNMSGIYSQTNGSLSFKADEGSGYLEGFDVMFGRQPMKYEVSDEPDESKSDEDEESDMAEINAVEGTGTE